MKKGSANGTCACHSGFKYKRCCSPFHRGKIPTTPTKLMRSRYCAYALGLCDYIASTTDATGPHWQDDRGAWLEELKAFTDSTQFKGLMILEENLGETHAFVTFDAYLEQDGRQLKMTEKSLFRWVADRWLYHSGTDPNRH